MKVSDYRALYISEAEEILQALEGGVLSLEGKENRRSCIDELFRHAHNLKGMSGAMGYDNLVEGSHALENILDRLRRDELKLSPSKADLLLRAVDLLRKLVQCTIAESGIEAEKNILADLLVALSPMCKQSEMTVESPGRDSGETPEASSGSGTGAEAGEHACGEPPGHVDGRGAPAGESACEEPSGCADGGKAPAGEPDAGHPAAANPDNIHQKISSTRVELERLDRLMDLVGELIISRIRLNGIARELGSKPLLDNLATTGRLIAEIQKEVMEARLVPAGQVFQRFKRLVRDISRELGKDVELEIVGSEIGLDRTVLEGMVDPLVHLIRNAIDHGIEAPAERADAGKPAEGKIVLSARRERNFVVLEVADDGRGIDVEKVIETGRSKKLTMANAKKLTMDELCSILTAPGFSTSTKVNRFSGRGMGMDIVKNTVDSLGGSIRIRSNTGTGTVVSLVLPINLSIIKALLFHVGTEIHALPIEYVKETTRVEIGSFEKIRGKDVLRTTEGPIAVVRPSHVFGLNREEGSERFIKVIIVDTGEGRVALVVNRIIGQQDVVIKALPAIIRGIAGISGATILGSGKIAFIWDPRMFAKGRCIDESNREAVVSEN